MAKFIDFFWKIQFQPNCVKVKIKVYFSQNYHRTCIKSVIQKPEKLITKKRILF